MSSTRIADIPADWPSTGTAATRTKASKRIPGVRERTGFEIILASILVTGSVLGIPGDPRGQQR